MDVFLDVDHGCHDENPIPVSWLWCSCLRIGRSRPIWIQMSRWLQWRKPTEAWVTLSISDKGELIIKIKISWCVMNSRRVTLLYSSRDLLLCAIGSCPSKSDLEKNASPKKSLRNLSKDTLNIKWLGKSGSFPKTSLSWKRRPDLKWPVKEIFLHCLRLYVGWIDLNKWNHVLHLFQRLMYRSLPNWGLCCMVSYRDMRCRETAEWQIVTDKALHW